MDQKTGECHDSNFGLMNINVHESKWTNNVNEKGSRTKGLFSWSWTDLLEVIILLILVFFVYHFLKKKFNKAREKKLCKTTRNLVSEMKARENTTQIQMPSVPSYIPFPAQSMMVPVHKHTSSSTQGMGMRGIPTLSQVYEPP